MATSTTTPYTTTNVSFVVELVDAAGGKTAWRGIYQGEAQSSPPSDSRLNSLAKSIFATLPKVPLSGAAAGSGLARKTGESRRTRDPEF